VEVVPARAAERVSWTTACATPSWMRGSGAFGTPSASTIRKRRRLRVVRRYREHEVHRRLVDRRLGRAPDVEANRRAALSLALLHVEGEREHLAPLRGLDESFGEQGVAEIVSPPAASLGGVAFQLGPDSFLQLQKLDEILERAPAGSRAYGLSGQLLDAAAWVEARLH
jgi:hypothetical protein